MEKQTIRIDLFKLIIYILKKLWLVLICAAIGFGFVYWRTQANAVNTYTASGTMYVYNANPNLVNYGYTNTSDLNSAVQLLDTYMVVVKSNKVLDAVAERLISDYPEITPEYIGATLSMGSVSETGVLRVRCTTNDPQKSADICNAVMDVAPSEIIRVVSAGNIEIIDYATVPLVPDRYSRLRRYIIGAMAGAVAAAALLTLLFLLNNKVQDTNELTERYTLPVLCSIRREREDKDDPGAFLLNDKSRMDQIERYAKLRMNLLYVLAGKEKHSIVVTSAISGEGKSTIAANLAISVATSGKRVLLVDADLRRACQRDIFHYNKKAEGLSEALAGLKQWKESLQKTHMETLDILPAGTIPPNPTELLESPAMHALLPQLEEAYDLVILDVPPINIVADSLALASQTAGSLFVVRQDFSDHREIKKALIQAEMAGMVLMGFIFFGEKLERGSRYYYYNKYYNNYYHKYDTRGRNEDAVTDSKQQSTEGMNGEKKL